MAARSMGSLSAWDNFSESYMKAREERAREERAKELSMREFDANQRAWNQEQRTDDLYQSYTKPSNAYGLDNARMTNELGAANQQGLVDWAKFNSGVTSGFTTQENMMQEIARQNYNANNKFRTAEAISKVPQNIYNDAVTAKYFSNASGVPEARWKYENFNPRNLALEQTLNENDLMQRRDAQSDVTNKTATEKAIAARPASTYGDMFTPRMYSTTSGVTPQPQAAKATATVTNPAAPVAQSPMAAMATKQPAAAETKLPVDSWIKPEHKAIATEIQVAKNELAKAAQSGNSAQQINAAMRVQQLTNSLNASLSGMQQGLSENIKARLGVY
jgi:hypothetical protein